MRTTALALLFLGLPLNAHAGATTPAPAAASDDDPVAARATARSQLSRAHEKKDVKEEARLKTVVDGLEADCAKDASHQLQEAKVYIAAENYDEAKKCVDRALKYADNPASKENRSAHELLKTIQRNTETQN